MKVSVENESVIFRTVENSQCESMFRAKGYDYPITTRMLCAGGEKGNVLVSVGHG